MNLGILASRQTKLDHAREALPLTAMRSGPQWPDLVTMSGLEIMSARVYNAFHCIICSLEFHVLSKVLSHS